MIERIGQHQLMLRVLQEIHTDEYFTELEVEQLITADLDKP